MSGANNLEQDIQRIKNQYARDIRGRTLPRALDTAITLNNIVLCLDSSAEMLEIFSGARGVSYSYKWPDGQSHASFVMREIFAPLYQDQIRQDWHIASRLMTNYTPEQQTANTEAFQRVIDRCATPFADTIARVAAANPRAGIDKIKYNPRSYVDVESVLKGIGSHFHPRDIQNYMERYYAGDRIGVPQSADLVFGWANFRFGLGQRYMPGPASMRQLRGAFNSRGVRLSEDPRSIPFIIADLDQEAGRNMSEGEPGALARLYVTSWISAHNLTVSRRFLIRRREYDERVVIFAESLAQKDDTISGDLAAEIRDIKGQRKLFESIFMEAIRVGNRVPKVDAEMRDIIDVMRSMFPKRIHSLFEKKWAASLSRA